MEKARRGRVPQWVKPGVWGAILGAVAIMIIGFSWWGWVLDGTAERIARDRADAAVVAVLAPLCVEQFMGQPDAAAKLTEFQKTGSWQQRQLVEKGGWATMRGSNTPNSPLASACAEQLTKAKI